MSLLLLAVATAGLPATPAAPAAKPFKVEVQTELYSYSYAWPAEAAAIPVLARALKMEMDADVRQLTDSAIADKQDHPAGFPETGYEAISEWTTAGQSHRLLSLQAETYSFEGGAHGLPGVRALLWDRAAAKPLNVTDLFHTATRFALLAPRYCAALRKEQARRREGERLEMFEDCPKFSELTIVPVDSDRSGRFERFRFTAGVYVAGPYVEGVYAVELPATAALIASMKPEYRASFEPQPQ